MKLTELFEEKSSNKSTAHLGTVRATAADIKNALDFVSKHTGISRDVLESGLVGSTKKTLAGKQPDSGDIDIAVEEGTVDMEATVAKMLRATGTNEIHRAGKGVYSFAVPVSGGRKVQVDLMFTPSREWAKWSFHSAVDSKYKAAVRSLLLVNMMKQIFEPGRDLEVNDPVDGEPVIRVRRSFKADVGLERLFKVRPMRKDGKGRTKNLGKATAAEVQAELKRMGLDHKFDPNSDPITDPDRAAELMFGKGVKAKDTLSVEQLIAIIKKRKDAEIIFKNTMKDLEDADYPLPPELEKYRESK